MNILNIIGQEKDLFLSDLVSSHYELNLSVSGSKFLDQKM